VRELLARGADVNARNNDGVTALHMASSNGRAEALRELLKRDGVNVNAQDNVGDTPLMDACSYGHLMAATLLIGHVANLALLNNAGRLALHFAERRVARDSAPPAAGAEPVAAALRAQHAALVAMLKGHGAT